MSVTHQQIAERAGVSRTLVTRALHRTHRAQVCPATRHEIMTVARELGYQPRSRTTHTIAFVTSMQAVQLVSEARLFSLCAHALDKLDYRLMLAATQDNNLDSLSDILNPKTVDGVIFMRWFNGRIKNLLSPKVPWVMVAHEDAVSPDVDVVTTDTEQAAGAMTRYLRSYGHKRICLVMGTRGSGYHERLEAGAVNALRQAGLPASNLATVEVAYDIEMTEPLLALLSSSEPPTAIICLSPEKTVGVMHLLCRAGYRVPSDISIISFMDSHLFESLSPAVTVTTALDGHTAEQIVGRLLSKVLEPDMAPDRHLIPVQVIERDSVAPPPNSLLKSLGK